MGVNTPTFQLLKGVIIITLIKLITFIKLITINCSHMIYVVFILIQSIAVEKQSFTAKKPVVSLAV